jgi:hypothetical protein
MTWRLFYSYSHQDSILRDKLGAVLAPLKVQTVTYVSGLDWTAPHV